MHKRRKSGISLIDVMIVLATLAIIAVLLVPQYNEKKARDRRVMMMSETRTDLLALKFAQELYFEKHGKYTADLEALGQVEPSVVSLKCPFDDSDYMIVVPDTTRFNIACSEEETGAIEGGIPTWLSEPGQETTRADLIQRSRRRMERIRDVLEQYHDSTGAYTEMLDSLATLSPGLENLVCPLVMKRFTVVVSDTAGYEITSHLDEVGSIVNGVPNFPPLPQPKGS
jgi:Tfp pilus assembly protein PilE